MEFINVADAVPETLSTPRLMHIAYLQVVKTIFKNLNVTFYSSLFTHKIENSDPKNETSTSMEQLQKLSRKILINKKQ
jgi:hypothetical protein